MGKKKSIIFFLSGLVLLLIVGIVTKLFNDDKKYYEDAHELNSYLEADGLKLMMQIEEVHDIYGIEEVYNLGFGGDFYEYPSREVAFSMSTDSDYDLFNKISDIRIFNPEFSLFGICVGMEESKAIEILLARGYKEIANDYKEESFSKGCIYIDFSTSENIILGIRIGVKDKEYDSNRIY